MRIYSRPDTNYVQLLIKRLDGWIENQIYFMIKISKTFKASLNFNGFINNENSSNNRIWTFECEEWKNQGM